MAAETCFSLLSGHAVNRPHRGGLSLADCRAAHSIERSLALSCAAESCV